MAPSKSKAPRKSSGSSRDARATPRAGLRSLSDLVSDAKADTEGRLTLRIPTRDLQLLGQYLRSRTPPASLQELFERALNEWFERRNVQFVLDASGKQSRAGTEKDPFRDLVPADATESVRSSKPAKGFSGPVSTKPSHRGLDKL